VGSDITIFTFFADRRREADYSFSPVWKEHHSPSSAGGSAGRQQGKNIVTLDRSILKPSAVTDFAYLS
jgi:hypothetical protein